MCERKPHDYFYYCCCVPNQKIAGVWTAAIIIWAYTVSGGLFSVAYTDVFQAIIGWSGCIVFVFYMVTNANPNAPPPSIGFPGMWIDNRMLRKSFNKKRKL